VAVKLLPRKYPRALVVNPVSVSIYTTRVQRSPIVFPPTFLFFTHACRSWSWPYQLCTN